MALLHVKLLSLRNKGIRTASATLMVVVFFSGVFLLVLHPSSHHPHPQSGTLPLSADLKDVSVRELTRTALGAIKDENENNFSVTVIGENNGHHDSNSNNYEKRSNSDEEKSDRDGKESDKAGNEVKMMIKDDQKGKLQFDPDSKPNNIQDKESLEAVKGDEKPQDRSEQAMEKDKKTPVHTDLSPQSSNLSKPVPLTVRNPDRQPQVHKPDSGTMSKPHRFQILGSNLEILPFQPFASPFIDSGKNDGAMEKKVITWHQPKGLSDSDQKQILREMKHKRKLLKNCPEPKCRLVYPLPRGVKADAVVFSDVDTSVAPPTRRHADQVYVLHKMSPPSSPSPLQPAAAAARVWSAAWRWAFNWTWSYRRDSNIWQPRGLLRHANAILPVDYFITLAESKTRAVAWIPRTCPLFRKTASKRNEFVEELRTYVPVAEFGSCSNHMCASENASCSQLLSQQFFFLLALEDELCPDYITEVFYRAWQEGTYVLPVVRGGANYASYFPLGTYIDANWFANVKQLYDFLAELIADRKLYAQLLWRKSHWIKAARKTEELALCHLCYKLHNMETASRTYLDVYRWLERSSCQHRS